MTAVFPVEEPIPLCAKHTDDPSPYPCGECAYAAGQHKDWADAKKAWDLEQERAARDAQIEANRIAASRCDMCNDHGRAPNGFPCHHNPRQDEINARGLARARAELDAREESTRT